MKKTVSLIILLIQFVLATSAREQYIYSRISQKEGLTSAINSIHNEIGGDLWIATQNGLYRFNGNVLKHYDDSLFKDKTVFKINVDHLGNLWVLTNNWLLLKKKGEDEFCEIKVEDKKRPFHSMYSNSTGVWFGSIGSLYRYDYSTKELKRSSEITDQPDIVIRSIIDPHDGNLICCSHNGIVVIDSESGKVSNVHSGHAKEISDAIIDSKGRIWLALYNKGITVYSKDGILLKEYRTDNSGLSNNIVLCMTERDSEIWAGTDGGGINIIDFDNDLISTMTHVAGDPSSLPAHSIKSIHTDHYGNIWAGSIREGLIGISSSRINTYSDVHIGQNTGLSNPTVLCLYEDRHSGQIWIGTDGEGLNRFDPDVNSFRHYRTTLRTKVVSIASYSESELIISIYGDRIWIFDKNTGKLRPLKMHDADLEYQIKYAGRGINVLNEADGTILLVGNTIKRYDRISGKCTVVGIDIGGKARGNFMHIGYSDNGIWLHDSKRIYHLKTGAEQMEIVGEIPEGIEIRCGDSDSSGKIWLATSRGLKSFDSINGRFSDIPTSLFDGASSVVCDRSSRIWVGTEKRAYAYHIESQHFAILGDSDGASLNEFLPKPKLLAENGDIYMGGVQGLLHIDARYEADTEEEPVLKLYEVEADHKRLKEDKNGRYLLPRHSKAMSISISALEKDIFREKLYRFSFSNNGGTYETSDPVLYLQKLPKPGKYSISVSCTKRDGYWTDNTDLLEIQIMQPWYLSWWFISLSLTLVTSSVISYSISARRRRKSSIELMKKEQEQKSYEEKVQMLINMSHELRTPLTLIMAPLKRLIKERNSEDQDFPTLMRLYRQSRRMKNILNMVLDLRKMEVGKNNLILEPTDTLDWINSVAGDMIDEERSEGIEISVAVSPGTEYIIIDRQKCETVLTNILMNAIKHSSKGDRIRIWTELHEGMIRISVSDEGPGLGDVDMSRMFTRFYKSNNDKYGSGIGLSYSKILVELHGGKIGTYNNEDKGATFWWEIPVEPAQDSNRSVPARAYLNELMGYNPGLDITAPESDSFNTGNMMLMLVDDNTDLLDFLREALCNEFKEIITAESGNEALRRMRSGRLPDIIVSDVNMPDGDGYQLCKEIKTNEKFSHIPIVLLTARGEEQSQSDSYRLGADGFIAKPFEMETLMELLKGLLRKRADVKKRYLDDKEETTDFGSNEEGFIIRFNKIVSEHMSDPELDQQLICRELGMSRALLYNKMKSITGTGAKEYITKIRIEKAKSLMENPSLSIAEIAEMTGFTSQSYFSTAFKNQTGMTPSQFRTNCPKPQTD